jgi:hypothetical protein
MQKLFQKKYDYLSYEKPSIDRCINCGDREEVQATITMEFGEGNYNSGSIFVDKGKSNNFLLYIEK